MRFTLLLVLVVICAVVHDVESAWTGRIWRRSWRSVTRVVRRVVRVVRRVVRPITGGWSGWSGWRIYSSCTKTCGGGTQVNVRTRDCNSPVPAFGGLFCRGSSRDYQTVSCNQQACPVNGGWSGWNPWSDYSSCTKTCGGGSHERTRSRSCTNPKPANGGRNCPGRSSYSQTSPCNEQKCPVDGGWTEWDSWSDYSMCTKTCGGGSQEKTRSRSCTNPEPAYGGTDCSGSKLDSQTSTCNQQECPVDGGWTEWDSWSDYSMCTKTCGGGSQEKTRSRSCTNPEPAYGGTDCSGSKLDSQTSTCNQQECPVDGGWTEWDSWSDYSMCTKTCGGGSQEKTRSRSCTNPEPAYGGTDCSGSKLDSQTSTCNQQECPVDGGWTEWVSWSDYSMCTKTCGGGSQEKTRSRSCTNPEPAYGGTDCSGSKLDSQTSTCNQQECPVDGGWTEWDSWSDYSMCTKTCGGGSQEKTRSRSCTNPEPAYGGTDCSGSKVDSQTSTCNQQECPVNGNWSDWTTWKDVDECSKPCGKGNKNQMRNRTCDNPAPQYGGNQCEGETTEEQNVDCNVDECVEECPPDKIFYRGAQTCGKYVYCVYGRAYAMECPPGTVWDQDAKLCNHGSC